MVFRAVFAIYEYNNNDKTFIITPANKVLGDNIISRMASIEIPFPSVVYVMFNYCHVIVYAQIEK